MFKQSAKWLLYLHEVTSFVLNQANKKYQKIKPITLSVLKMFKQSAKWLLLPVSSYIINQAKKQKQNKTKQKQNKTKQTNKQKKTIKNIIPSTLPG